MPGRPNGQHRHPDHLPAGRAEGERGLLVQPRRLEEDLAADRGDDRQDHDGEHDGGGEDRAAGAGRRAGEERDQAEVVVRARRRAGWTAGASTSDAPQAEDDRRDGGEQVDDVAERLREPARRVVRDEQGDADGERHGDQEREDGGPDRAEGERQHPGQELAVALRDQLRRVGEEGGRTLDEQEGRDERQDDQDQDAGAQREAAEDAVAPTLRDRVRLPPGPVPAP